MSLEFLGYTTPEQDDRLLESIKKVREQMSLADKLKWTGKGVNPIKPKTPVWGGPEEEGITFSLLSRFLVCRERFRLLVVEGLKPADTFNHRIEYGNMWHVCEEQYAAEHESGPVRVKSWEDALVEYARSLCQKYPLQQEQVDHWYNVCRVQFPIYVDYWSRHPDVKDKTPLLQEQVFCVPYRLPSGRTVKLRGKWDSVDLVGERIYLQENKTKGDIYAEGLRNQLTFDLQTLMYLRALEYAPCSDIGIEIGSKKMPIAGVRYNVIRRPLSGGRGTIRQHQPTKSNPQGESKEDFYKRLAGIIREEPEYYFMRWNVDILPVDIERFKRECLDPILEQLCDWWEWISFCHGEGKNIWDNDVTFSARPDESLEETAHASAIHFRFPYGPYSTMLEGTKGELDEYLHSGSMVGLSQVDDLFLELK